ncbi:GNAT family N-acetyltransferase [Ottowia sp.]|uniref:GNAT family N-acetyltransferase n=1 Tax=Ottowia sp. TaxID=1898956 RepID=UPI0039E34FF6
MAAQIRFAQDGDLAGVHQLYRALRPHDPELAPDVARARWRELTGQPHLGIVVADADGTLAATCMIATLPNLASGGRPIGLIEHVVTLPAFRGQGLARQVMVHALDFAWSRDCCKVMLLSGARRTEAHRLYAALGFDGDAERGFVIKP